MVIEQTFGQLKRQIEQQGFNYPVMKKLLDRQVIKQELFRAWQKADKARSRGHRGITIATKNMVDSVVMIELDKAIDSNTLTDKMNQMDNELKIEDY